jgi:hypothetical protein
MHMYEYNKSSTTVAQDIQRHSGELNIKLEDTVDNHTLVLVIYTSSGIRNQYHQKDDNYFLELTSATRHHTCKHLSHSL